MPMWRNWQTHMTQNHAGNHVGSSPTIGTPSQNSLESKDFRLFFFFYSVSYTLVFSGKILTIAFAEDTLLEKSRCV